MPLRDCFRSWPAGGPNRWSRSLTLLPICTLVLIFVLGMFKLSGTSVGLVSEVDTSPQAALQLRPNRSDEWRGRTPLIVRQANNDFAPTTDLGIGGHDTGVLSDMPVKTLGSVLKPHSWLYFVFDVERAFAMEWWLTVLGPFLGVYALMAVLTRSRTISALSGILVAAAPVATWWTVPSMGLSILYGALSVTAFLLALQIRGRSRFVPAALSGWLLGCFGVILYLPWLIPLGLLFVAIALSQLRGHIRDWRRLGGIIVAGGAVTAIGVALYLRDHHAALSAINNSVYPGKRVTHGGEASAMFMFDAPLDVFTTHRPAPAVSGTNTSEAASGLMFWFPVAIAGGAFSGFRSRAGGPRALAAVMVVALAMVLWALEPLPDEFGIVLGLTKVQGSRLVLPLAVAGAIAAGLYVHRLQTDGSFRPRRDRVLIATATFAVVTATMIAQYMVDAVKPPRLDVVVLILILSVATFAILRGRAVLGLGGACLLLLFSAVRVNPLQIGLGPLTDSPLTHQIEAIRSSDPGGRWAVIGGDSSGTSMVMASGAPSATGVSWYADQATWEKLDPTHGARFAWDRYAYVEMYLDDSRTAPLIELLEADLVNIITPTCNGALQLLGIRYIVTPTAVNSACLQMVAAPTAIGERYIYTTTLTLPD